VRRRAEARLITALSKPLRQCRQDKRKRERAKTRILMLSWEYPPRIIGGLARHVEGLSRALASLGHEVHVVTLDFPGAPAEESSGSLYVHRVAVGVPAPSFHTWVLLFNHFFEKRAGQLARQYGSPEVVHMHDWLTASGGVAVKHLLRVPLVMTFHSTESSRSSSSGSPESSMVEGLEWWGSYEAARVVAVSNWMRSEVVSEFKIPPEKAVSIPNAVDIAKYEKQVDVAAARSRWHVGPGEKLVTAVGRLTSQKGFDDLIKAYPKIRRSVPNARLLVVGDGYMRGELEALAEREEVKEGTTFAGFVSDPDLVEAVKASDAVVVPSRFEPFGIIALEAMAAGVPVVVSRVGGLAEIVDDSVDGLEVEPNNPDSIADATVRVLSDSALASRLAAKASEKVRTFSWESSARKTLEAYEDARRESRYE
jgi:glycogen(starch) synthase